MDINIRQKITESMKKIDFKDRRYALPAIAFPFVIFSGWWISKTKCQFSFTATIIYNK